MMERPLNLRTKPTSLRQGVLITLTLCAVPALWTQQAAAHIRMDQPVARNVWGSGPFSDPIKESPCGSGENDPRTTDPAKINTFAPGETITVSWEETVDHPGYYRISIDMDGQDDFVDPTGTPSTANPPVLPTLMDGIQDATDGTYSVEVTLPNETCDNCTLQLVQYMSEKSESYYICADLVIEGEVAGDGDGDGTGGAPDTTTETTEGAGGTLDSMGSGGQGTGGALPAQSGIGGTANTGTGGQLSSAGGSATSGETDAESGGDTPAGAGCAVSPGVSSPGSAITWLCGLVGALSVVSARRRLRR